MTLHHFFVPPDAIDGSLVTFPVEQGRQMRTVLRLRPGHDVIVLDGTGIEIVVRLDSLAGKWVTGTILERRTNLAEPRARVTLYLGLLKAAKLEMVLQKGTELGITGFVPLLTERSVAGEPGSARQHRFEAIVREAAEQCRRGLVPHVSPPLPFAEGLQAAVDAGATYLLYEHEPDRALLYAARQQRRRSVGLIVGPEGGFTDDEAALAREVGAEPVTLGPRILRAETAAIVGSSVVLAALGELEPSQPS